MEIDPATLEARTRFTVPRSVQGKLALVPGGVGIEAMTFVPETSRAQLHTASEAGRSAAKHVPGPL